MIEFSAILQPIYPFYNTTINLCNFSKGLVGNLLVQIFLQDLTYYTTNCPLQKVKVEIIYKLNFSNILNYYATLSKICIGQMIPDDFTRKFYDSYIIIRFENIHQNNYNFNKNYFAIIAI